MSEQKAKYKSVCEDTVYANIFSFELTKQRSVTSAWEELCDHINNTITKLSNNYIWHRDSLKVYLPITNQGKDLITHLESSTCFGDNIEDEWFIVYLIFKLSMMFQDLIIQLTDNDGDFLLIEAANVLPSWANPETTENRVFIHKGHIHMIPPTLVDLSVNLTSNEAIKLVVQFPDQTKVATEIEEAVWSRLGQYPQKIYDNFHNAVVKLPLNIAALLMLNPSFISSIVDSYCNHDMFDIKCCQDLEYKDPICVKVKFTKCLYAMLMHSKLIKIKQKVPESDKKTVLGFKLTCGFHILMKRISKDIYSTKEFIRFIHNLTKNGYFRENIEHSKEYNKLFEKAKQYFLEMECPINTYVAKNISEAMASNEYQSVKASLGHCDMEDLNDDSDEWLNIDPNKLNDLLNTHYDSKINFKKDDVINPDVITNKLTDFFKESSDYEGIETTETKDLDNQSIEFDSDDFVNCLEKMMNILSANGRHQNVCDDSEIESDDLDEEDDIIEDELTAQTNFKKSDVNNSKTMMFNLTQSIKEEGLSGPSSNLLKTIGLTKSDIVIDSDDD